MVAMSQQPMMMPTVLLGTPMCAHSSVIVGMMRLSAGVPASPTTVSCTNALTARLTGRPPCRHASHPGRREHATGWGVAAQADSVLQQHLKLLKTSNPLLET